MGQVSLISATTLLGLMLSAGCPRAEDLLEQNDSPATATVLEPGVALTARVVQGDPDVFAVSADIGTLRFDLRTIAKEEEDCVAFRVFDPAGAVLYSDVGTTCSRGDSPQAVAGATLEHDPGVGFVLRIPAAAPGVYVLEITELGNADNIFTFSWHYAISVTRE
jgi:hypothetical protein